MNIIRSFSSIGIMIESLRILTINHNHENNNANKSISYQLFSLLSQSVWYQDLSIHQIIITFHVSSFQVYFHMYMSFRYILTRYQWHNWHVMIYRSVIIVHWHNTVGLKRALQGALRGNNLWPALPIATDGSDDSVDLRWFVDAQNVWIRRSWGREFSEVGCWRFSPFNELRSVGHFHLT